MTNKDDKDLDQRARRLWDFIRAESASGDELARARNEFLSLLPRISKNWIDSFLGEIHPLVNAYENRSVWEDVLQVPSDRRMETIERKMGQAMASLRPEVEERRQRLVPVPVTEFLQSLLAPFFSLDELHLFPSHLRESERSLERLGQLPAASISLALGSFLVDIFDVLVRRRGEIWDPLASTFGWVMDLRNPDDHVYKELNERKEELEKIAYRNELERKREQNPDDVTALIDLLILYEKEGQVTSEICSQLIRAIQWADRREIIEACRNDEFTELFKPGASGSLNYYDNRTGEERDFFSDFFLELHRLGKYDKGLAAKGFDQVPRSECPFEFLIADADDYDVPGPLVDFGHVADRYWEAGEKALEDGKYQKAEVAFCIALTRALFCPPDDFPTFELDHLVKVVSQLGHHERIVDFLTHMHARIPMIEARVFEHTSLRELSGEIQEIRDRLRAEAHDRRLVLRFDEARADCERFFRSELGNGLWEDLDEGTHRLLIHAEYSYRRDREAKLEHFSHIGLLYVQALENEIERKVLDRLANGRSLMKDKGTLSKIASLLVDPFGELHRRYLRPHLRGFDNLWRYVRTLKAIRDNRNYAAHEFGEPYTVGDLNRLRELLFGSGFLREFMDGIQPR